MTSFDTGECLNSVPGCRHISKDHAQRIAQTVLGRCKWTEDPRDRVWTCHRTPDQRGPLRLGDRDGRSGRILSRCRATLAGQEPQRSRLDSVRSIRCTNAGGERERRKITRREEKLRGAVKAVIHCNALEDPGFLPFYQATKGPMTYDVVTESAVLCDLCSTEADLTAGYVRLSKLLKSGGKLVSRVYLIDGISSTSYTYQHGDMTLNRCMAPILSEKVLHATLTQAGFSDINITRSPADHDAD